MEIQFDDNIKRAQISAAHLADLAAGLLGLGRGHPGLHFPVVCDQLVRDLEQPLQHHPQLHLRRDHRARHDDGDHHRRHRSVGRLGAVPVQHGPRGRDACRLQHRGRHRRLARHGAGDRRVQRRADRLSGYPAVCGHARHAVDRAQPGDGRLQQHRGVPVRPGPRQAAVPRRRRLAVRHRQPRDLHARAGAADRLRAALDPIRPLRLRHRRQRACRDRDRRAGAAHQGRRLHDLRAVGRHCRHHPDRLARRRHHQYRRRAWNCR